MISNHRLKRFFVSIGLQTIVFLLLPLISFAQTGERKDAYEFNKRLGRGINFMGSKINGNHHDPFDFALIKKNKFTHVRIGSRVWQYVGDAPDYTIDPEKLDSYQNAVDWALDHDLMVMMDPIHAWDDYSDADLPKLKKLWEQIATHFKDYPVDSVSFEIFNEPRSYDFDLEAMLKGCINIIRDIPGNEKRIIIVSGQSFSTRQALIDAFNNNVVFPTDDPYLIGTFHYYDPRDFTKQGVVGGIYWADGGDNDPEWEETITKFQEVVDADNGWAEVNNTEPLPIYNGEYGVDNGAPPEDRTRWLWWVRMVSEQMGFSNAIWNLYNDSPDSKGMGPWTDLQKNDPTTRYLHQEVMIPYRNRYEGESGTLSDSFIIEQWADASDSLLVSAYEGIAGDQIVLADVYIARSGTYDATLRYLNKSSDTVIVMIASGKNSQTGDSLLLKIPPTADTWTSVTVPLHFSTGEDNVITLQLYSAASAFHFDYLAVTNGIFYDNLYPSTAVDPVYAEFPLSVPEQHKTELAIYPNPANEFVRINGHFQHWELLSIAGKRLMSGTEDRILLQGMEPAVYLLKVDNVIYKLIIN